MHKEVVNAHFRASLVAHWK